MSSFSVRSAKAGAHARCSKLAEIQQSERLLRPGIRCVDLGAAPGGWSQYAVRIVGGATRSEGGANQAAGAASRATRSRVVATDILPMDEIPGVDFVQGDFRDEAVLERVAGAAFGASRSRPCFVRYGPQHGRHRCRGSTKDIHVFGGRPHWNLPTACYSPEGDCPGEIVPRCRFRSDYPRSSAALRTGCDEKAKGGHERAAPEIYLLARQFGMV